MWIPSPISIDMIGKIVVIPFPFTDLQFNQAQPHSHSPNHPAIIYIFASISEPIGNGFEIISFSIKEALQQIIKVA